MTTKRDIAIYEATVVEVRPKWVLVEYEKPMPDGTPGKIYLQRKLVPWELFPVAVKGPTRIRADVVARGIEYSNVDLVAVLGEELPAIKVRDLEDALRRDGLWVRDDYRRQTQIVAGTLQRLRGLDVGSIVNAALSGPKESAN